MLVSVVCCSVVAGVLVVCWSRRCVLLFVCCGVMISCCCGVMIVVCCLRYVVCFVGVCCVCVGRWMSGVARCLLVASCWGCALFVVC